MCLYALQDRIDVKLFSESATRWVVEVPINFQEPFETLVKGLTALKIGTVTDDRLTIYDGKDMQTHVDLSVAAMWERWNRTLWDIMG